MREEVKEEVRKEVKEEIERSILSKQDQDQACNGESSDIKNEQKRHGNITTRLNTLLTKITKKSVRAAGNASTNKKDIRIQVRWMREVGGNWINVKQAEGGGSRFIALNQENQTFEHLLTKSLDVYFGVCGKNCFNEDRLEVTAKLEDVTGTTVNLRDSIPDYLKERGLFPSKTWFVLRTSLNDNGPELENFFDYDYNDDCMSLSDSEPITAAGPALKRKICDTCSGTYFRFCIRCKQDKEFEQSLQKDSQKNSFDSEGGSTSEEPSNENITDRSIENLREQRIKALSSNSPKLNLEKELNVLSAKFMKKSKVTFNIRRRCVFNDVMQKMEVFFSDAELSPFKVEFTSMGGKEAGVDTGGPTRELISLFYQSTIGKLTYGRQNNEFFIHDLQKLTEDQYMFFGKFVSLSLLHGCNPPYFSAGLSGFIVGHKDCLCCIDNIPTIDLKIKLENIRNCDKEAEFQSQVQRFHERFDYGYNKPCPKLADKTDLLQKVAHHIIISMQLEEIQQFLKGLEAFGVLDLLRKHPLEAMKLFTYNQDLVDPEVIKSCFDVTYSNESDEAALEEDIFYNWKNFLDELGHGKSITVKTFTVSDVENEKTEESAKSEKKLSLGDVMMFLTGSTVVPNNEKIKVLFDHITGKGRISVSTCQYQLTFPVVPRYTGSKFSRNITEDIINSPGFGIV